MIEYNEEISTIDSSIKLKLDKGSNASEESIIHPKLKQKKYLSGLNVSKEEDFIRKLNEKYNIYVDTDNKAFNKVKLNFYSISVRQME